jgi:hypothetical protein
MKLYACSNCDSPLYFENNICLTCNHTVGFDPHSIKLLTLNLQNDGIGYDIKNPQNQYRYCSNSKYGTCNWLIDAHHSSGYCIACELNRTIPDIDQKENLTKWKKIEIAKHRLIYSLLQLNLPIHIKPEEDSNDGLAFDFLADNSEKERVMTGHANGLITLNIEEADEVKRVKHKNELGENYRTLLGHFRHEVGHYYWDVLIKDSEFLPEFRELFGDESIDYGKALEKYYDSEPFPNWSNHYISMYATAHPWEDWAETWANYLHLMDALETAYSFGIKIRPDVVEDQEMQANIVRNPYKIQNFDRIMELWLPLTFALNSLNRSMGHPDFYPFFISADVTEKLRFIHKVCGQGRFKTVEALTIL